MMQPCNTGLPLGLVEKTQTHKNLQRFWLYPDFFGDYGSRQ